MKNTNPLSTSLMLLCVALATQSMTTAQKVMAPAARNASRLTKPAPAMVVGPNVQVSKVLGDKAHNEIHLAANPRNPLNLLGGSMVWLQDKNTQTVVAYASFDGGKTWSATLKLDDELFHSDPAAGFDLEGTAYFLLITNTGAPEPKYYTYVYRSKDGGRSWLDPTIIPMLDRHYLAVDDTRGKYHGSLYIDGSSTRAVTIQRSRDRGATFDGAIQAVKIPSDRRNAGQGPLVVLSDGTLVIPFLDTEALLDPDIEGSPTRPNATLKVVTSIDGGATFSEPITIAQTAMGHMVTSNANHFSFAMDPSAGPFKDRLYVIWSDSYSRGGQFSRKKPRGANILLSYSANKGKSWSKPILVNDDPMPSDWAEAPVHFQPVITVNKDGVVGVMYYDRRDSANNLDWTVRFAASLDGGETFLPSVQVAESPNRYGGTAKLVLGARGYGGGHMPQNTNYRGGALKFDVSINQFNLAGGHTAGLAADADSVFHPFWVDNRTGVAQIWTAPVTINRKAMNNGDPELATLQDVSERVILRYLNPNYDAKTGRVSVDVQMQNTSGDTLLAPVKLRVVAFASAAGGIARIVGADNGMEGVGAVWDLNKILINQKLKANQRSGVRRLEFRIADMPPLNEAAIRSRGSGAMELIHIEARALSNVQPNASATQK
jgi:hypothetical protein